MKKYILILMIFSGITVNSYSQQLTTSLSVNRPSATLSEWANNNTSIIFIVNSLSDIPRRVIIKAELKLTDGTVVASKDLSKAAIFTITRGTRIFYAKDVLPLEITIFTGQYKSSIEKTGKLPSGTYQLSVQLVEPTTFAPVTPVQNKIFNLTAPQLPILMTPHNDAILDARKSETAIIFRWTGVPSIPSNQLVFRLQVFEILPNQQPMQALRANQPWLDKSMNGQTQYVWRPQMSFSVDSIPKKFIWTIQTLYHGPTGQTLQPLLQDGNGESRSEPKMFTIKK